MLTTRTIKPHELTLEDIRVWRAMLRKNLLLNSPFFLPEFSLAVGRVNVDARVIVVRNAEKPVAFLPFQYTKSGETVAMGGSLNDFQGLIAFPGFALTPQAVLESAGIKRLFCAKLYDWSSSFAADAVAVNPSPSIDLSDGYAGWESDLQSAKGRSAGKRRGKSGTSQLKQLSRKERKLTRECGPLRFEFHTASDTVLQQLIIWKRGQYQRTGEHDVLANSWPPSLLRSLLKTATECELQPALSALYAGETLVAAHYGLLSQSVCHWWFPTYNPLFARYSPGKIMLRRLLFEATEHGVTRFDFGPGDEDYKFVFANASVDVCRVIVDRNPVRRWLRSQWYHSRMALKRSAVAPQLRSVREKIRSFRPTPHTQGRPTTQQTNTHERNTTPEIEIELPVT